MAQVWSCHRDGACCRLPGEVVLTHAERGEIERAAPSGVALTFLPHEDARFVRLQAGPCPLYDGSGCSVYAVRPFNCRRYACGRDDVTTEPFVEGAIPVRFFRDRPFRRQLQTIQTRAYRKWAVSHGWEEIRTA